MKSLCALCVLCVLVFPSFALNRDAFTFTKYDLDLRIEPEQQRLGVRGHIALRNDSSTPQKSLVLQISSTLNWRSIALDGKPVQFETHQYTSDIDHTGALSEAIVVLPGDVPAKGTVELAIGYEGVIPLDATRLTRIGLPEAKAKHLDWDQISTSFTAVRGIGDVAWYPISTNAASLSEEESVSQRTGRWLTREAEAGLSVKVSYSSERGDETPSLYCGGGQENGGKLEATHDVQQMMGECSWAPMGLSVPTIVMANYQTLAAKNQVTLHLLADQKEAAEAYAEVASQPDLTITVGSTPNNLQILALPDEDDASFMTGNILLMPFKLPLTNEAELNMVYARARLMVSSSRPWIEEGLAHYAQVAFIETQKGRQAALDYLDAHKSVLVAEEEKPENPSGSDRSFMNAPDGLYLQAKSMDVWWMLRDMTGNDFTQALRAYQAGDDKDPSSMQKLLEQKSKRNLQWFFDDWVYHDRGLPDFRVTSVFSSTVKAGGYLVTVEIENLGSAGAEVPIILQTERGEVRRRLEVHGKSKASVRIETQSAPREVTVNDGSVPESDISNNTYKIGTE